MGLRAFFLSAAPAPARPVAPHVRAAVGHPAPTPAAQAKAAPAPARPVAPHVRAAVGHPAPAPAAQAKAAPAPARPVAPHVRAAVGHPAPAPAAQAKTTGMKPPAAHVAAAVARSSAKPAAQAKPAATATARTPAPHLAAALQRAPAPPPRPAAGVLQRSARQVAWQKRRQGYIDDVGATNQTIHGLDNTQPSYFTLFPDVPADVKVSISGLPSSGPLKLGQTESQMVNFSYSMKEISEAAPELQTAIISDKSKKISSIRLSANDKKTNKRLVGLVKKRKLSEVYKDEVRPYHVTKRRKMLERTATSLSKTEIRAILDEAKKDPQVKIRKDFDKEVNRRLALKAHKSTRKDEGRRRMKSARQFAYGPIHSSLPVDVANNDQEIHAESAIYTQTEKNTNEEITMVYGTKVPCLACQAFFRGKGAPHLMIDHSSFAWLSESSLKQLGFKKGEIQQYLLHIRATLGNSGINEYGVSSGEIAITDLTVEDDPSSDSEDEDARTGFDYRKLSSGKKKPTKKDQSFLMEIETVGKGYK